MTNRSEIIKNTKENKDNIGTRITSHVTFKIIRVEFSQIEPDPICLQDKEEEDKAIIA